MSGRSKKTSRLIKDCADVETGHEAATYNVRPAYLSIRCRRYDRWHDDKWTNTGTMVHIRRLGVCGVRKVHVQQSRLVVQADQRLHGDLHSFTLVSPFSTWQLANPSRSTYQEFAHDEMVSARASKF